jgi:hypothetical protein
MTGHEWAHRWFGYWREYGAAYSECPSIHDFVDQQVVSNYNKEGLRFYLTNAPIVASTSRINFPCPFTGRRVSGSLSARTDGEWNWFDDLPDYIEAFNVRLPAHFEEKIRALNFCPPTEVSLEQINALERPPVGRSPTPTPTTPSAT